MSPEINIDPVWEEKYASGHLSKYPWDLVVSFIFRNRPKEKPIHETSIIEVGFGTGNNLWFAAREGFQVAGVEGSLSAVNKAKERFNQESLEGDLRLGDFASLPFANDSFDLAIDRGSLVCVGKSFQKKAINEIWRCLRPGGRFLFNGYTDNHSSRISGVQIGDGLTAEISRGTLTGVGSLAFLSRADIDDFFSENWQLISVERKEIISLLGVNADIHSEWIVIAEKA
jgi:SAM-dependent methyltransferase